MRRLFAIVCIIAFAAVGVHAQNVISGTVSDDATGEGLSGVTVFEKGTTNGTFTDGDGKYRLEASSDAVIVFRLIGYTSIEVAGGGNIALVEDVLQIDPVVVTALGVSRDRKAIGYSVQNVGGDQLNLARDANVVNNLSGRVAGVNIVGSSGNVGSSSRITIRGNSSITGNNQPLFVVNGVPVDNGTNNTTSGGENVDYGNVIADINPEDIENITVLKGPNAAALYGSRAANGVVLITTKKGNEAGVQKGIGISYSLNAGFSNPLRLPDFQNEFGQGGGQQFGYYDGNFGGLTDGIDESWGPAFDTAINEGDGIDNDGDGTIDEPGEGGTLTQFNGTWGVHDADGHDNNYDGTVDEAGEEGYSAEPWQANPDNIRNLFQTGVSLANNIALTARGDKSYARFSYTNLNQTGMVPNTDYQRNSFDASFGGDLSSRISMDANVKYIRTDSDNRPGVGYAGDNVLQQTIWAGRQVDFAFLEDNVDTRDQWGNYTNWNHSYQNNPYRTLQYNTKPMNRDRMLGFYRINYKINDWLTASGRIGTDFYREQRKRIFSIETKDHPNGEFTEDLINLQETNADILLSGNKRLGDKIDLNFSVGGNRMNRTYKSSRIIAPALVVPGVYNVGNSDGSPLVTDFNSERAINSLYGQASVGYDNFLYLDVTGRNDWSSTLPADNNSYFYPSVTGSIVLSEALDLPSVFDLLKLRAGWAEVGADTDPYQLTSVYGTLNPWGGTPTFIVPGTLPNANLLPERTSSFETGFEMTLFKNRLSADFTYYNALTRDQIIQIDVAPSTGATRKNTNAGSVRNSGFEVMVQAAPVKTKSFTWTLGLNFARNVSEVVELNEDVEAIRLGRYWALDLEARVGEPFGSFRGFATLQDDNGNLILDGGLPQRDPNGDDKVLGTIQPDYTLGVSNGFTFKGVTISTLIDIRKGSDLFSVTYMFGRYAGVLEESLEGRGSADEVANGYVFPGMMYADAAGGDSTLVANDVPVSAELYNLYHWRSLGGHELSIFDATFVKLREVAINYRLPSSIFDETFIGGLEVGAYGRNLAILYSGVPHVDPESAFGSQTNVQGFEFGALPSARTLGFTLRANF